MNCRNWDGLRRAWESVQMNKAAKSVAIGLTGVLIGGLKVRVINASAVRINTDNLNGKVIGFVKSA